MTKCEDCYHNEMCQALENYNGIVRIPAACCGHFKDKSLEAEPVKHGRWKEKKYSGSIFDYSFVCSECHKETPNGAFIISPGYCPNCGVRMDGDSHEH